MSPELLVGIVLPLIVGGMGTLVGLDRDRAMYPLVMIVIAAYYVLFALIGGDSRALLLEGLAACVFIAAALVGFRTSLWLVAAALAAHGLFDLVHARLIANPGVPPWWPIFCAAYDLVAAGYLAWMLSRRGIRARPAR